MSSELITSTGTGELETDLGLPRVPRVTTSSTNSSSWAKEITGNDELTAKIVIIKTFERFNIVLFNINISLN